MKKLFLFIVMLLMVTTGFAQEAVEAVALDPSFSAIKSLLMPAVSGGLLMLFMEAKKYMFTPEWDWKEFAKTNVLPFGLTVVGAVVIYLLLAYLPFLKPYLEILTESDLAELTAGTLMGAATLLVKFAMKPRKVAPEVIE